MIDGEVVAIRCAHGDTVLYLLAEVMDGRKMTVEAAVSNTLPMAALLGTDTPELGRDRERQQILMTMHWWLHEQ